MREVTDGGRSPFPSNHVDTVGPNRSQLMTGNGAGLPKRAQEEMR